MKSTSKLIIFVLTFLALTTSTYAQSPREQLQQLTAKLQTMPNDNALRKRIIKLGAEIKPAPAVPEEANRFFVRGNVFQKEAKDASGYELAIAAYRDALRIAPWWGDAYFNLAGTLGSAGKFDEAIASFKLSMISVPAGSAEAREAQNRIYAIEAKSEMASRQATATAQQAEAATVAQVRRFEGNWYRNVMSTRVSNNEAIRQSFTISRDPNGNWRMSGFMFSTPGAHDVWLEGAEFKFKDQNLNYDEGAVEYTGRLSSDGSRLRFTYRDLPHTPAQAKQRWEGRPPNNRFGGEEWLKE